MPSQDIVTHFSQNALKICEKICTIFSPFFQNILKIYLFISGAFFAIGYNFLLHEKRSTPLYMECSFGFITNYFNCAATSAAKSSSFFSIPSPVSKRTNFLTLTVVPTSLDTCSKYFATDCFPSSAFT